MSTAGLAAGVLALVLGAGDALDAVAAGGVVASTSGGNDVAGEPTGVVDADALAAAEVGPGKVEPAALEVAPWGDGEPDGVALGETYAEDAAVGAGRFDSPRQCKAASTPPAARTTTSNEISSTRCRPPRSTRR
jgi:hypothetical protein